MSTEAVRLIRWSISLWWLAFKCAWLEEHMFVFESWLFEKQNNQLSYMFVFESWLFEKPFCCPSLTKNSASLSQRLMLFDAVDCTTRVIKLRGRQPSCPVCGDEPSITELIDYEQFCGARATDKVCACSVSGAISGVGLLSLGVLGGSSLTTSSSAGPGPRTRSVLVLCLVQFLVLGCCHWVCWVGAHWL